MWFRGMHYNCWGQEDGGEELRIEMNGGVLWRMPRPGRGCSAIDGWMDGRMDGWIKSGNACYHSVQNLLSSSFLLKNLEIKTYRTIILLIVLYGWATCSLKWREKRRLRVFENRVLRRTGPKRKEKTGNGENYIMRSLMICTHQPILFGWSNREARYWRDM